MLLLIVSHKYVEYVPMCLHILLIFVFSLFLYWNISLSTLHVFVIKFQKSLNKNNSRQDKIIQVYVYIISVFQVLSHCSLNLGYFCPALVCPSGLELTVKVTHQNLYQATDDLSEPSQNIR